MTEGSVMRTLQKFLQPAKCSEICVIFDKRDPSKWAARLEIAGHDRWFKGKGKNFKEEAWFPHEDLEKQMCLP